MQRTSNNAAIYNDCCHRIGALQVHKTYYTEVLHLQSQDLSQTEVWIQHHNSGSGFSIIPCVCKAVCSHVYHCVGACECLDLPGAGGPQY